MPFLFLLIFALLSVQGRWPEPPPWLGDYGALLAPWVMAACFWLLAVARTRRFCRQLLRHTEDYGLLWRQYQRGNRRQVLLLTACYLGALFGLGWGHIAQQCAAVQGLAALTALLQFTPFLLGLMLCWVRFYQA